MTVAPARAGLAMTQRPSATSVQSNWVALLTRHSLPQHPRVPLITSRTDPGKQGEDIFTLVLTSRFEVTVFI